MGVASVKVAKTYLHGYKTLETYDGDKREDPYGRIISAHGIVREMEVTKTIPAERPFDSEYTSMPEGTYYESVSWMIQYGEPIQHTRKYFATREDANYHMRACVHNTEACTRSLLKKVECWVSCDYCEGSHYKQGRITLNSKGERIGDAICRCGQVATYEHIEASELSRATAIVSYAQRCQ